MTIMINQETKSVIDNACRTAEDFTRHYYDNLDKRRSVLQRLYMDTAILVWNGNGVVTGEAIGKFYSELPLTEFKLGSLDIQKILDSAVGGKLGYLVTVAGMVRFGSKNPRAFNQCFMLVSHNDKWKIVSDCFRCAEPL